MIPRPSLPVPRALLTAALLALGVPSGSMAALPSAHPELMPISAVRPGMVGVGYTVFQGTKVDTFSVAILGVLRAYRPGGNLILARASNPFLDKTGIIAGMSGSPVYVGGKLLGAVSYTWGFLKEPLAGITPIGEMLDLLPAGGKPDNREDERLGSNGDRDRDRGDDGDRESGRDARGADAEPTAEAIRPIGTPLMMSGFSPEAERFLQPWLRERGLVAVPGGAPSGMISCDSIVPGSAVGVQLVSGDWNAAAIGTLTYRDGNRVLAFGHPFTSMGWVDLPLTGAEITTIMSSAQISNKVGSATSPCGTLTTDRIAGISGTVGASPAMIPVRVAIRGAGGRSAVYRFDVVRSRLLTPGLLSGVVVSSVSSALNDAGFCTVRYEFTSYWNGGKRKLTRGDAMLSNAPVGGVGEEIAQSLTLLLGERFRPSRLDSAVVSIDVEEGIDALGLIGMRLGSSTAAPGDSVQIEATFRRSSRETETRRFGIRIPLSAPEGDITVRVCDGEETERWERARAPQKYEPQTLDDLMALYQQERRTDRLYVQLYAEIPGAVIGGREIAQAPRSVLSVLGVEGKKGEAESIKGATLAERSFPMSHVVHGCETATLTIAADRRR